MPVTASDFLWESTGFSASGTSVVVTHPDAGGTTAGTTVVVMMYTLATTVTTPTAFAAVGAVTAAYAYVKSNVSAGETSWTFTLNLSTSAAWYMAELDNVALVAPFDGNASATGTVANGATASTGTLAANGGSSGVALAMFGANKAGTTDVQSWAGYTNSFTERVDVAPASGTAGRQIAVAYKLYSAVGSFETTATFTTSVASASTVRLLLLLRSADASINAPLAFHTGFEFGTHAGMGNAANSPLGVVSSAPAGTWGTNYLVQSGSARNGGYGLQVASSASIAYVLFPILSGNTIAVGMNIKPVSGSGTTIAATISIGSNLFIYYDATTSKFGLHWSGAGTTEWQTGTTPAGTWTWIELCATANIASAWHVDWRIETGTGDGTQTSPSDSSGTPPSNISVYLGYVASQTATFDYDDVVYSKYAGAYPLGPHTVRLLVPETTGASVSGTAANFNQFTANGTLAAFASTNGALLDEVPPTISASSDGVVQVTLAASDYMNFPMTTYTATSTEIVAGVRALASLWGGTGTGTGTLGFRGYDGTTETTFVAASTSFDPDSLTTASATYPLWYAAMWNPGTKWTQALLDAAALRLGFSTDATPDMGASAMYLEVATRATPVVRQITQGEADEFTVDIRVDPDNSASVSYLLGSTHATCGATFNYSISGTPQTPVYVAASSTQEVVVRAAAFADVSIDSFEPDPLP